MPIVQLIFSQTAFPESLVHSYVGIVNLDSHDVYIQHVAKGMDQRNSISHKGYEVQIELHCV